MGTHTGNVITLANSIIGVSVLAMPFCFKQCGILLAILMLLFSNIITRLACHYLMKSAILEKRKNFEMLAFRVYGPTGKLIVELCIIGFMLGTCVAYFVIMGDLGPGIIGPAFGYQHPSALRPSVLIAVAVFVVLPLGLLKNVDSLSAICAATLAFYFCLVLKVMGEAIHHLVDWDWMNKVYYWKPSGILQCIPIFSMALSCQTQLFEIFDPLPSNPLDRMNAVVKSAINMVTLFYISVGFFGYVAYCDQTFSGNLMMNFSPTITSDVIKIGFLLSVAVSFPLVIFPCRASIYSLFFSKGYEHAQTGSAHIPESRFKCITLVIVTASLVTGLLIPNIEIVLGLVGSTIGVIICVIIPGVIFISLSMKNNNERLVAKFLVCTGLVIMVLGTYANLYATEEAVSGPERNIVPVKKDEAPVLPEILGKVGIKDETLKKIKNVDELAALPELKPKADKTIVADALPSKETIAENKDTNVNVVELPKQVDTVIVKDAKKEPPVPVEPEVIHDVKKEPPVPEAPIVVIPVSKEPEVIQETKKEPPSPEAPSDVLKKAVEKPQNSDIKVEDIKPVGIESKVEKPVIDSLAATSKKLEKPVEDKKEEKEKEKIIEKIKEHEEAQRKLNEEGVKLLKEIKDYVNMTKDSMKLVNVKTGAVTDLKVNQNLRNDLVVNDSKKEGAIDAGNVDKEISNLASKMAKGIPLPLAVKGQIPVENKGKDIKKKIENEVVDKIEIGRDLLGGDKEIREKRDIEGVLKVGNEGPIKNEVIAASKELTNQIISVNSKDKSKSTSNATNNEETLAKLKTGLESCAKNDSSKESHSKVEEIMANDKKMDELIKSPSYLSHLKPVLDTSPLLLSAEVGKEGIPEMPKKRDLKSVTDEELKK